VGCWLDVRGIVGRLLVEARDVSLLKRVQAVNGIRPVLFIGIGGAFFPEVRAAVMSTRPSPPSNANIEEYLELYLHPLCSYGVHEHNFAFIFGFTHFPSGVPCLRMSPFHCLFTLSQKYLSRYTFPIRYLEGTSIWKSVKRYYS
jgi:hypothetical protein